MSKIQIKLQITKINQNTGRWISQNTQFLAMLSLKGWRSIFVFVFPEILTIICLLFSSEEFAKSPAVCRYKHMSVCDNLPQWISPHINSIKIVHLKHYIIEPKNNNLRDISKIIKIKFSQIEVFLIIDII